GDGVQRPGAPFGEEVEGLVPGVAAATSQDNGAGRRRPEGGELTAAEAQGAGELEVAILGVRDADGAGMDDGGVAGLFRDDEGVAEIADEVLSPQEGGFQPGGVVLFELEPSGVGAPGI